MTVYVPKGKSQFYHYDFWFKKKRYTGSTGLRSITKAREFERDMRNKAALGQLDDAAQMTLDQAAGRWWDEVGQHKKTAAAIETRLERMLAVVGGQFAIVDIDTPVVSAAMERRRKQTYTRTTIKRRRKGGAKPKFYPVSNRTVNLDVIDTLRPILRRAKKRWGAKGMPEIDWGELTLPTPKPKPKELVGDDLPAVLAVLRPHWHDFARFKARYGPRISEMFFSLAALDISDRDNARLTLRERKNDEDHIIPLLPEDAAMFAARVGRARAAGLDTPWFRELKGGRLKALKYGGAECAFRRAMTKTGLRASKGLKGAHDLRRNAGMKMLRETGNLRTTQRLLGHASIQSTMTYAHAIEDDVKAGLQALSRNSPGAQNSEREEPQADQATKAS